MKSATLMSAQIYWHKNMTPMQRLYIMNKVPQSKRTKGIAQSYRICMEYLAENYPDDLNYFMYQETMS